MSSWLLSARAGPPGPLRSRGLMIDRQLGRPAVSTRWLSALHFRISVLSLAMEDALTELAMCFGSSTHLPSQWEGASTVSGTAATVENHTVRSYVASAKAFLRASSFLRHISSCSGLQAYV